MRVSAELPPGVTALFFDAARRRRRLEARLAACLEAEGFSEVVLPILDYLEPYEELLTPASRGELYRFVDRGGEVLALRADFTPMLARLMAPRLAALELPLSLFYRGDVVRYQEEQAGRMREFYQLGAERVGAVGEGVEGQILRLFLALLAESGARSTQVVLGLAGALDSLLLASAEAGGVEPLLAAVARRERSRVRAAGPVLLEVVERGVPARPQDLGAVAGARLAALERLAAEVSREFPAVTLSVDLAEFVHFTLDPRLARDSDPRGYYDGFVFRAYAGGRALPVGAGGRYDSLFRRLGADVPAVGFSLGLDRLTQAVEEQG